MKDQKVLIISSEIDESVLATIKSLSSMPALLNREGSLPTDNWYMVAHKGEYPIVVPLPEGKSVTLVQVIDDTACIAMVNRFNSDKTVNPMLELLVDQDHFSENADKTSKAYGWINALENRADGLYGKISWTTEGNEVVLDKSYRFISPVWEPKDCQVLGNRKLRPLRLDKAALTNEPNIKDQAPLKNRQQVPDTGRKESSMDHKSTLLQMLGLTADAADEQIAAAQAAHTTKCQNRETEIVTLSNRVKELETKELEGIVEKDLDTHAAKIVNRAEMKTALLANRAGTLKVLESLVLPANGQKFLNRADGKTPAAEGSETDKSVERQKFVDDLKLKNRCNNTDAWSQAASLRPDLFGAVK